MTLYFIEVRAVSDRHDIHAHQLVREIQHLPTRQLPSLTDSTSVTTGLHISTAQLYLLSGSLDASHVERLTNQLLLDPVIQQARILDTGSGQQERDGVDSGYIVDVFFHPGVTDTLAESVLTGAQMLGIEGLQQVETGRRYILDQRLSEQEVETITQALLFNPVIQRYTLYHSQDVDNNAAHAFRAIEGDQSNVHVVSTVPLLEMDDQQLMEVSKAGLLSLNLDEMRTIQRHYRGLGRAPTDVELETLAQTWSEHCSHKTFKATVQYREVDANGQTLLEETIPSLIKRYIMNATEQVRPAWLVSAFVDNAGIIRFTETQDIAFKVETHNHPSAIEPFGGANTGVGGVIRDVMGVSAQPIACTDVLCFGPPDTPADELPAGVLSPRRIASGVVSGVRDYGNKMGIPTVNGAVLYHPGFIYNPLVFCGCLGILPHKSHVNAVEPGDLVVVLGGRTGRDGVHGATFSSGEMSSEINAQAGSAVQIGAPITEKKVADVIVQARDRQLYHAITDCGAGGFSSAVGEMGEKTGVRVELAKAPLKYQGLAPWEIWLSEAQERMVLAVPPEKLDDLLEICAIEEVEASIIGTFTGDHRLTVMYQGEVVADMAMEFLHDGRPERLMEGVWTWQEQPNAPRQEDEQFASALISSLAPTLLALLRHPSIASKEEIVRRYDHEVQGATVGKPLVGRAGNGPGDAAVLKPILDEASEAGIVLSNGVNPLYGTIDPYHMAINAVDEALRNLTAVGGDVTRVAILDNFCWGNPTDPEQMGGLVRAVKGCYDAAVGFGTPFISGKDSLNNEYRAGGRRIPVIPTLLISAVGVIENAAQTVDMSLKTPGNLLYLIGATRDEMGGSHYAEVIERGSFDRLFPRTTVPQVDIPYALKLMKALGEAIRSGLVRSCHDLSEGGLALAAAEMALASKQGATIDIAKIALRKRVEDMPSLPRATKTIIKLFSESPTRFIVEIAPEQFGAFEKHLRANGITDLTFLGNVTNGTRFVIKDGEMDLVDLDVDELQDAWKGEQA